MIFKKRKKQDEKIFCIGANKTGTTSLEQFFRDHNFVVANQMEGELLLNDYINRDWKNLINYCNKYDVFQDFPFSYPYTFIILHYMYPNAKFILSVRDSSEQWFESLTKFHSKLFGINGNIPTKEDLMNANYIEKGGPWKGMKELFGDFDEPYDKDRLIQKYENYNNEIRNYFKSSSNFIEINVSKDESFTRLCDFLNIKPNYSSFPHKNKTNTK